MKYLGIDFISDNSTIYDKKQPNKRYDYDGSKDIIVATIAVVSLFLIFVGICILKTN